MTPMCNDFNGKGHRWKQEETDGFLPEGVVLVCCQRCNVKVYAFKGGEVATLAEAQATIAELRAALAAFTLEPLAGAWVRCAHCYRAVFSNSEPEAHAPDCPYTVAAELLARLKAEEEVQP